MKLIIAGSRGFNDYSLLREKCDFLLSNVSPDRLEIVSGTAKGADQMGERYAEERGIKVKRFPADWDKYGKGAGYRRNSQMSDYADALIAFWDGESRGTLHMINLARKKQLKIKIVKYTDERSIDN